MEGSQMMKAVIFSLLLSWSNQAATITGKVVSVADGDTITVLDATKKQHKIRFHGIDTPETKQPFGSRAKAFTSKASRARLLPWRCAGRGGRRRARAWSLVLPWKAKIVKAGANV
jgi:endonuclease YncB( thermonuclease family)